LNVSKKWIFAYISDRSV